MPELLKGAPGKAGSHRALDDIRESIEELRYYREALFKDGGGTGSTPDAPAS
jgi:oligoribonuclease